MVFRTGFFVSFAIIFGLCIAPLQVEGQGARKSKKGASDSLLATFRDCPDCPEMVRLPSGTFVMGAGSDEAKGFIEEGPQRSVHIKSFSVAMFDLTRGEWKAFVGLRHV